MMRTTCNSIVRNATIWYNGWLSDRRRDTKKSEQKCNNLKGSGRQVYRKSRWNVWFAWTRDWSALAAYILRNFIRVHQTEILKTKRDLPNQKCHRKSETRDSPRLGRIYTPCREKWPKGKKNLPSFLDPSLNFYRPEEDSVPNRWLIIWYVADKMPTWRRAPIELSTIAFFARALQTYEETERKIFGQIFFQIFFPNFIRIIEPDFYLRV